MTDDDLLDQLGALEREYDHAFPHEWEDVLRGTRTPQEVARARREAGDDPQEVDDLATMLQPLDDGEREAWVDRLAQATRRPIEPDDPEDVTRSLDEPRRPIARPARLDEPSDAEVDTLSLDGRDDHDQDEETRRLDDAAEPQDDDSAEPDREAKGAAEVLPLPERRRGTPWLAALAAVLVAAAVVLWLRPRDEPVGADPRPTLPSYELVVRNQTVREVRSTPDTAEIPRYLATTRVHWIVRPEQTVTQPLSLRIVATAVDPVTDPPRRLLDPGPAAQVTERGVIEVRGTFGALLPLHPGRWSLQLVVAPTPPADLAELDRGGFTLVEPYVVDVLP